MVPGVFMDSQKARTAGWEPEGWLSGEEAQQAMDSNHERPVGHSTDFNFHSEGDGTHWRGGL